MRIDVTAKYKGLDMFRNHLCVEAQGTDEARDIAERAVRNLSSGLAQHVPPDEIVYVCWQCNGECGGWEPPT